MKVNRKLDALGFDEPQKARGALAQTNATRCDPAAQRPVNRLTRREREVMLWTAEGKTAFEVGVIVGLTERTVNFHISRTLAKLGATNKTQAAVKAAVLGML